MLPHPFSNPGTISNVVRQIYKTAPTPHGHRPSVTGLCITVLCGRSHAKTGDQADAMEEHDLG